MLQDRDERLGFRHQERHGVIREARNTEGCPLMTRLRGKECQGSRGTQGRTTQVSLGGTGVFADMFG